MNLALVQVSNVHAIAAARVPTYAAAAAALRPVARRVAAIIYAIHRMASRRQCQRSGDSLELLNAISVYGRLSPLYSCWLPANVSVQCPSLPSNDGRRCSICQCASVGGGRPLSRAIICYLLSSNMSPRICCANKANFFQKKPRRRLSKTIGFRKIGDKI